MKSISLDLSNKADLALVGHLAWIIQTEANALGIPIFMAGAMARDLILAYGHGIDTGRKTADVDWAMMVNTWDEFEALKAHLVSTGEFSTQEPAHRLMYGNSLVIDLIPFGGIADEKGIISWPPEHHTVMTVLGFDEAYKNTLKAKLPGGAEISVISLPALALLKLFAWNERHVLAPRKDAHDFALIARNYIDAGNQDRLYEEFSHLLDEADFDYGVAGARMLGCDIARIASSV
ncbi:MAG: nucleotidyl transferase AbiEii/AbiGii toxin family protein, partial [Bacillota bacterium]